MENIDNNANTNDNANQDEDSTESATVADLSGSEDAMAKINELLAAKDDLIGAYETQVASLRKQVSNLLRNGAVVASETDAGTESQKSSMNANGGFGKGVGAYEESGFDVKSLGNEIGTRKKGR